MRIRAVPHSTQIVIKPLILHAIELPKKMTRCVSQEGDRGGKGKPTTSFNFVFATKLTRVIVLQNART